MREGRGELMLGNLVQVQAEEKHEVRKFDAVDGSQGVELENAGDGIGIFELRQPRIGNLEFGIFFFLGDFLAQAFHIARGYSQTGAQFSKMITGRP
jgi:hypothetical protein